MRLRQNPQWRKNSVETNDQYVVFADIINKINRSSGKVLISTQTSTTVMMTQKLIALLLLSQPDFCTRLVLSVCAHPSRHLHELNVDHGPEDDASQVQDSGDGHLPNLAQPLL